MKPSPLAYWVVLPLLVVVWANGAWYADSALLPSPLAVFHTLQQAVLSGELQHHLLITLRRVAYSFAFAMALGTLIGLWMGRSSLVNALLDPLLVLLLNMPALVVIILLYVWFGLVEVAAVMAVVINKIPNVAVTMREGARSLDFRLEQMAQVYRFTPGQRLRHVWMPQLFPYFMAATRGGLALIWKIVLVVELLGRSDGIGFQLHMAFQIFDVASLLAYSLAFIAVVQLIELVILQPMERHASRWRSVGDRQHA